MKKNIILILAGVLIGAGAFYIFSPDNSSGTAQTSQSEQLYTCGMHPSVIQNEPGNCPICGMKLTPLKDNKKPTSGERKILYWQAPMDPTEIYDKPGKSKMGMDLVPVYEDEAGGGAGGIHIDGRVEQNMNLQLAEVTRRNIERSIRAYGRVTVAEDYEYTVTTKIKGWIEKLYFNTTGQYVKKGQPLLEIYSPELVATQEEFLLAWKNLQNMKKTSGVAYDNANSLYTSAKRRLELWDIPESEIQRLQKTGEVKRTTLLRSPVNGYMIHKAVVEGDEVGTNLPHLFLIADLSKVWVEATVYESELPFLKLGQKAHLKLDFLQNRNFDGTVDFIYPYLDPKTRSANVRIKFDNVNLVLKPDMHATVNITSEVANNVPAIPASAVIRTGVRNIVFVETSPGYFNGRDVKLGAESDDGFVEIVGGLLQGEKVVTSGQFLLDSESQTREAIAKLRSAKQSEQQADSAKMKMKMPDQEKHTSNLELHTHDTSIKLDSTKLYTCVMHPDFVTSDPDTRCPFCEMKLSSLDSLDTGQTFYTCPMHPQYLTTESFDRCPICEMKLVKKE
ncbi:MAG: efflux RND transporter periplasmic adaptor subunit [Calditrichae bacterium]|nr:efflux RND transporter periplasmic adaptor subunit [Calditrichia bacterium]